TEHMARSKLRDIRLDGGRVLRATPVLDTYWRFACARQAIFHRRVRGEQPPWTDDAVLGTHRFTNAYRASDRVSQFLSPLCRSRESSCRRSASSTFSASRLLTS